MGLPQESGGTERGADHKDGDEGLERGGHRGQGSRKPRARGGMAGVARGRLFLCAGAAGLVRWPLYDAQAFSSPHSRQAAMAFILVTVVLDMLSFGIIIPVLPKLVEEF
ncbi:MAG: hypothetical protein MRJ92_02465 [Nitrospira sp.]|nr:hypothetical protein [Nitrospira sp.]